ncbi:MAG TPA: MTH938/NDUFAF3 family protein [Candidatus Limnocylindria bacterium]|jgi:hypothetical protein|nr:MTH938/NDUFAF3 family protein [Candidatus Limnocylindria bacterium]
MTFKNYSFGTITIDGKTYAKDVVIEGDTVRKRKKKASRVYRDRFGHTPLSTKEEIPWKCERLVIGAGAHGALPVMDEVREEAARRKVELVVVPTPDALDALREGPKKTNAILHLTC